jgi:hypothetical protein
MRTLVGTVCLVVGSLAQAQTVEPVPVPTNVIESVKSRLVQIDLIVDEKALAGRALTADDLVVVVGERTIDSFHVDRLCSDTKPAETIPDGAGAVPPRAAPRSSPTLIFFFDHTHLTMMGRDQSIEMARTLIDRLVVNGARAIVYSSASSLRVTVPLTDDRARLIAGVDAMRKDPREWDSYAATEDSRLSQDFCLPSGEPNWSLARTYAREEEGAVRLTKTRLIAALDGVAEVSPPKGLVYFGDMLRQKAGLLYFLVAAGCPQGVGRVHDLDTEEMIPRAAGEIDAMVDSAIARGAHYFTVEAEGLSSAPPGLESTGIELAQDTLGGLAAETGGESFLGAGARADLVASHIASRISCPYILSFPPADLPRDRPLAITVESRLPGVSVKTQGRIVIQSDAALLAARLSTAFIDPASAANGSLHVALIPRGGDGRKWQALAQVRLDADAPHKIGVDLGASVVQGGKVVDHFSKSIGTAGRPRPLIVEHALSVAPGPISVRGVAYDRQRDDVLAATLEGDWANPAKFDAVIAPITVLQTRSAASSKDGKTDAASAIALDANELIDRTRPVALESAVCRGANTKSALVVERRLEGNAHADFAPMTIDPAGEPCIQTVDIVQPADVQGIAVDYRIIVRAGGEVIADQRKSLRFAR